MKLLKSITDKLDLQKPYALTWDGWDEWHNKTKVEKPAAYFIMETVPNFLATCWRRTTSPFTNFRWYLKARFFDRYHLIHTRLSYGYHDTRERMLYGTFSLLVDYVELELSHMHRESPRPWYSKGIFRIKSFRCVDDGIKHLMWETSLTGPAYAGDHQATTAKEVLDLYFWWTKIRPLRQDPWDLSGSDELWKDKSIKSILSNKNKTKKDKKLEAERAKKCAEIEEAFLAEDNKQLERLIKIRPYLWT